MSITIETGDGRSLIIDADVASIGSDESCDVSFVEDGRLDAVHAKLSKVLFQWRIDPVNESAATISISEKYGASGFLQSGDRISLSADGPVIVLSLIHI